MDIDEITSTEIETEETPRLSRRQLVQQAIALAVQSRWQEAADANQQIVELLPQDAEAYNRLGKALTELGRITEACTAYESTLRVDPANLIAQRNLERLSHINESEAAELAKRAGHKLDPRLFIEETGKTGVTQLQRPVNSSILATLAAGDQVMLARHENRLVVTTVDGTHLGEIDERLATRLIRLIDTGNEYQAGVVGVDDRIIRIIVRETFQAPQNAGRISFPPRGKQEGLPRPYLREGLIRRAGDEEDEDELDVDGDVDPDDEDEDETGEFGFHEASLDES